MQNFSESELSKLYKPANDSHKGQNGKLMVIGGSKLFHAASIWSLTVATRIVDMVYYASVEENNRVVVHLKEEFRNGIIISRNKIYEYIEEADCVLIGPGLPRKKGEETGDDDTKQLTESLLRKYKHKKWVIDGGSLQTIDPALIPQNAILTPHRGEFEKLFNFQFSIFNFQSMNKNINDQIGKIVKEKAEKYNCIIVLKGQQDIVCSPAECVQISGGNAGMTKGGTGDVLAGLVAAMACKNDPFLAARAASYINKKAGDSLYQKVGPYFNASDLCDEIPKVLYVSTKIHNHQ